MGKLRVSGVVGLDGECDLVVPPYTQREWHEIKKHTGLRPLELDDAWQAGDPDVMIAFAWVSLTRDGKNPRLVWEELGKTDLFSVLTFDFSDEEAEAADAGPPEPATIVPSSDPVPETASNSDSSGPTTPEPSETPAAALRAIGTSG